MSVHSTHPMEIPCLCRKIINENKAGSRILARTEMVTDPFDCLLIKVLECRCSATMFAVFPIHREEGGGAMSLFMCKIFWFEFFFFIRNVCKIFGSILYTILCCICIILFC